MRSALISLFVGGSVKGSQVQCTTDALSSSSLCCFTPPENNKKNVNEMFYKPAVEQMYFVDNFFLHLETHRKS